MIKLSSQCDVLPCPFASDEARYEWQMTVRANYLILHDEDSRAVPVNVVPFTSPIVDTGLAWIQHGEVIAGSFMCNIVNGVNIEPHDVDIYFHSLPDVDHFISLNNLTHLVIYVSKVAYKVALHGQILNLIYGVHYDNPEDLISHFDIRACSIACDPNTNTLYAVKGATHDCAHKHLVFNPIPHNATVARLVKYTQRGFNVDPYQRLFFAELIRSSMYNTDLELSSGYRGVHK